MPWRCGWSRRGRRHRSLNGDGRPIRCTAPANGRPLRSSEAIPLNIGKMDSNWSAMASEITSCFVVDHSWCATQIRARGAMSTVSGWQPVESLGVAEMTFPQRPAWRTTIDGMTRAVVAWARRSSRIREARITILTISQQAVGRGEEMAESLPSEPGQLELIDVAMAQDGDFMLVFTLATILADRPKPASRCYYCVYRNDHAGNPHWGWFREAIGESTRSSTIPQALKMNSSGEGMVVWKQKLEGYWASWKCGEDAGTALGWDDTLRLS